jgi:hypothetical protein
MAVELNSEGGFVSMNDWSDYALARLRKQEDDKRVKDQKFAATQKLLQSHGIQLWHEVREIVRKNVESLNAKAQKKLLAFEVTQHTILRVINVSQPSRGALHAIFDQDTGKLEWDCDGKKGEWELGVSDEGSVHFHGGVVPMVPTTPASIAKEMLDALLFD